MKRVYILMGGMMSLDGVLDSRGMTDDLAPKLRSIPGVVVKCYLWSDWGHAFADQNNEVQSTDQMILIGYSGGGPYGCKLANAMAKYKEDVNLMVLYDPSPQQWMVPIKNNVQKVIVYQNTKYTYVPYPSIPPWVAVGCAKLDASALSPKHVTIHKIAMHHLKVQYDDDLNAMTTEAVKDL